MKKNLYFRAIFQRANAFKKVFLSLFMDGALFFRLILEVFIRKNMGRRYFKLSSAIFAAFILAIIPFIATFLPMFSTNYYDTSFWGTIKEFWLWYGFVGLFMYFSFLRKRDIQHIEDIFDMQHFSKSSGEIHPFYWSLKINGKPFTVRQLETSIEPLPFFILGVLLILFEQKLLGGFLAFSAYSYAMSYRYAYMIGDDFIMDKIDEIICNKELNEIFIHGNQPSQGFNFYGTIPKSKAFREQVYHSMFEVDNDNFTEAI